MAKKKKGPLSDPYRPMKITPPPKGGKKSTTKKKTKGR